MYATLTIKRIISIVSSSFFVLIVIAFSCSAQMSLNEIIDALDQKTPELELIKQIEKRKVNYYLKSSDSVNLVFHGATDAILHTIETHRKITKLPIKFNGWKPFGDIAIAPWNNNAIVYCKGFSMAYPGLTTARSFFVDNRRTLVVKVEDIKASSFSNENKMLKVFVSDSNVALCCIADSLTASDDREFVLKKGGEFRYRIPESLISNGSLIKLGLQFGPGEYNTFKVSAWFE